MSTKPKRPKEKAPIKYIGEIKNQLRHGHGVYVYENRFFRYEGQWENGKKHGHGKLLLGDGGYYEGTFAYGEIEGHGYRVFGLSGATYSGQFHRGEMHGQGVLCYPNGEQYEGSWAKGRKEGSGILTEADGSVYEGGFHNNARHGEGVQLYSNGDQYEGDWVSGKRHGHGLLRTAQGTIYDGQWRGDVYHGQGSIMHCSGVTYEGMWINGKPANEPVELRSSGDIGEFLVEQGKRFTISFECVDAEGKVASLESGRSFEVTAAVRKNITPRISRSKSRLHQMNSQALPDLPAIDVPFGYAAQSYELLQEPVKSRKSSITPFQDTIPHLHVDKENKQTVFTSPRNSITGEMCKLTTVESSSQCSVNSQVTLNAQDSSSNNLLHAKSLGSVGVPPRPLGALPELSKQETQSLVLSNKSQDSATKENDFLSSLVTPHRSHTKEGIGIFEDLYLPPLPTPDMSQMLAPLPTKTSLPQITSNSSLLGSHIDTLGSVLEEEQASSNQETKSSEMRLSTSDLPTKQQPSGSPGHSLASSQSRKKLYGQESLNKMKRNNSKAIELSKEKLLQVTREKYCPTGTYVIIISEVTEPPFLEKRLPTLYVEVKVIPPRAIKSMEGAAEKVLRSKTRMRWK